MIKYTFILLGVYFLYYAGNIVYDLFLKKDTILQTDLNEEFSLGDYAQKNTELPNQIGIEDVENVNTPKSFTKSEFQSNNNPSEEKIDINDLRKRFEEEQDIDDSYIEEEEKESNTDSSLQEPITGNNKPEIIAQPTVQKEKNHDKKKDWKNIMKLSETSVKLVSNYEGQKVYNSIM